MSTDFFRRYLDLLNEAETTGRLIGNQPFIPGKPLSPMQMATVDFARSMGNQMGPEVDRAYDLAKQSVVKPGPGLKPGGQSDSTTNKSDVSPTNARSDRAPTDFAPTHFHKNNLGGRIPLMQTPDGGFWWETTATSDDGGPVQRGSARKSIQPWIGDTENRSSGFSGKSSVDGVFKNGQAIEFPEGMTWKEYAAKALSSTATGADGPGQGGQPPPKEIPKPELVAPNTTVALPSSGTFSNDDALAALAKKIKDGSATTGGNVVTKSDSTTTGGKNGEEDSGTLGGDTRCKICGTKQKDHQNLRHAFVAGDSTQPTIAATAGVQPGGAIKRGAAPTAPAGQAATPDVSKVAAALTAIEKILEKYKVKLKENINRLAPVDQMKAWRTLMEYREVNEADRKPTKAEIEAYLKNLPPDEAPAKPATPTRAATTARPAAGGAATPNSVISNIANQLRALAPPETTSTGGTVRQTSTGQTNKASARNPNAPRFGSGTSMPRTPYQVPGAGTSPARAAASTAAAAAPEASALSKVLKGGKNLLSKLALPIAAVVEIFEGYRQISALPTDMPRDQYRAAVSKIVARLVSDFGLFWVGAILGGALAGAFTGGVGTVVGFVAGGASGIAASYLLGDSVGAITDNIVDKLYGTGGTSSMSAEDKAIVMQNITIIQDFVKANPGAVSADLKVRIDRVLAAAKAAGVAPGQGGQPPEGKKAAPAVPAMPTATSTAPAKLNNTLDGIDNLLKKYNFESQEFDSFFDSLTECEQRRFISKHLHLLSESEQMAERRDMLNEAGAWGLGQKGLRWLARKLYKAGGSASAGGTPVPPAAGKTPSLKPGFKTGVAVGGTVGASIYGYFKIKEIIGGLLDTIKDPETAKVITITPEDTAAWIQFNKELEAALPDQATYDALPQDAKDRLSMIAARAEAMDKAIKESRAKAQ